jgi:hypothetical protein
MKVKLLKPPRTLTLKDLKGGEFVQVISSEWNGDILYAARDSKNEIKFVNLSGKTGGRIANGSGNFQIRILQPGELLEIQ